MKASCECTRRFTCRHCLNNRKPYFWTPNSPHEEHLARLYPGLPPEKRAAAYEADKYHAGEPNT